MHALMMDFPLNTTAILQHAARWHGRTEIVSRGMDGALHRYTYAEAYARTQRLAHGLAGLGLTAGDRVGTIALNGFRHFELYFAVPGMGAVLHTINPRLHPEQLTYIINHADDRIVCFDTCFAKLIAAIAPHCPQVHTWVALDRTPVDLGTARCVAFESLLDRQPQTFYWPRIDEHSASSLCFTSGTTGHPKGVLYSHRSTVLHAMAVCWPDALNLSARDVLCPIVPMFHVNAWGLPYGAALSGCKLVLAGGLLDGPSVHQLFEAEGVNLAAGVPTVWLGLLNHVEGTAARFSHLKRVVFGGAPMVRALMERFQAFGIESLHAWGMTEMSPVGTCNTETSVHAGWAFEQRQRLKLKQGRVIFGVDMRIVDAQGETLPHDGLAFGHLQVRGPWIVDRYFGYEESALTADGWFDTGDVATIDADGYMQITDRAKDVIKSGGEWISSQELENVAMSFPAVGEAAAIAVPHPKWDERPVLVVVVRPGHTLDPAELLAFFEGKVAKWWVPDAVHIVPELPHNATGKVQKNLLREKFAADGVA